jgi:hypothetical protein
MPARQILFALPKKYSKTLVQKNAIAEHRSFSLQNAFSIAILVILLSFVNVGNRRTFATSFTIAVF